MEAVKYYESLLMSNKGSPFLMGNLRRNWLPITDRNTEFINLGALMFRGFKYRELRKWALEMKTTDISEECQLALKVAAAALKVHGAVHGNFDLCKFVMKNYLTYEGMKRYIASMERLWKAVDITIDNPEEGLRLKREIEFYRFLEGRKDNIYTLPSVSSFPRWEVKINKDKPSKMYLCQMSPPHPITVTEFRKQFANYLDSLDMPDIIELPLEEELLQPSDSAHASRGEIRKDKENETDLFGPFLYQSFMTGQDTPREVWLPPVEYKRSNLWWHIVLSPILKKIPDCCLGKSEEELLETMQRRFEPCRSIDLKRFRTPIPARIYIRNAGRINSKISKFLRGS
jgi:hypothetical protein